jgi:hypothetical protein
MLLLVGVIVDSIAETMEDLILLSGISFHAGKAWISIVDLDPRAGESI